MTMIDHDAPSTEHSPPPDVEPPTATEPNHRPPRWRRITAAVLAVVAALAAVLGVVGAWAERTLLDTDAWVDAVEPLPSDPAVATELASVATDELFAAVDIEQLVADVLPSELQAVSGPIAGGLRTTVEEAAEQILLSDEFRVVWRDVNRLAHEEMLVVLRGDGDEVTSSDGTVTLNLIPIVNNVLHELTADANSLFGTDLELPDVTESDAEALRTELSNELGIELPPDFAHIVVYQDDRLAEVQDGLRILADTTIAFWVVAVMAGIAAFAVSVDRRRTTIHLATAFAALATVFTVAAGPIEHDLLRSIDDEGQRNAVQAAIDIALRGLGEAMIALALAAAGVAILAWLTGPARSAVRLRSSATDLTRRHTAGLQIGGLVAAVVAAIVIDPLTAGWFVAILIALAIFELAVTGVSTGHDDEPATPEPTTPEPRG